MDQAILSTSPRAENPLQAFAAAVTTSHAALCGPQFDELKNKHSKPVMRACLMHVAKFGKDEFTQHILPWLGDKNYFPMLVDPRVLSLELATAAVDVLRENDRRFFVKFAQLGTEPEGRDDAGILRALELLEGIGECDVLFSWLRGVANYEDDRIRSKATKLLCKTRPNRLLVERQLKSDDKRVRANAIEALWFKTDVDSIAILRYAQKDNQHRVAVNALIGLYHMKEESAMQALLDMTSHSSSDFRAAAIWAFGQLADVRAIPALEALVNDPSKDIAEKAQRVLDKLLKVGEKEAAAPAQELTA